MFLKRCFLLIFICILNANNLFSQDLSYYTGGKVKDYDTESFLFFNQDSTNLYSFRNSENNYYVEVYNKDSLKMVAKIILPLTNRGLKKFEIQRLFIERDTFKVFYSYFDRKSKFEKLEMVAFNKAGLKLGKTKLVDSSAGRSHKKAGDFSIIDFHTNNGFLSSCYKSTIDYVFINIDHFNNEENITNSQNYVFDKSAGYIVKTIIDDNGNLYSLVRSKLGKSNVNWSVQIHYPDTKKVKVIKLVQPNINNIFMSDDYEMYFGEKGTINFISTYALNRFAKYAEGIYRVQINSKSHTLISESVVPFSCLNKNTGKENYFSLEYCTISSMFSQEANGLKIVFESRIKTVVRYNYFVFGAGFTFGSGIIPISYRFNNGNIIIVDLDSNNVVKEIHEIMKQQYVNSKNYKYSGFATLNSATKSYYIYNELPKNLSRIPDRMKEVNSIKTDETVVIYALVDSNKVKRNLLIDKIKGSGINAVIPESSYASNTKDEIYILRRIESDIYLTKIFIKDNN